MTHAIVWYIFSEEATEYNTHEWFAVFTFVLCFEYTLYL